MRSPLSFTLLLFSLALSPSLGLVDAQAQTAAASARSSQRVAKSIADRPSDLYRFERHHLDSADGKRRYRIELSIPATPPPDAGYPALYMLDGNAAMDTLTEHDLAAISGSNPPVLVAIGYDTHFRNDAVARSYDYTPSVYDAHGRLVAEPTVRGRVGGGATEFLQLITSRIKPLVHARARINRGSEYLWGHSYGGLFVLHTLFTQPQAFSRYIAGDPSAWWHEGALMHYWHDFQKDRAAGKHVAILTSARPNGPARQVPRGPAGEADRPMVDQRIVVKEMADGLRQGGAQVTYEAFPQYGHGDMIRVSLERALNMATQP